MRDFYGLKTGFIGCDAGKMQSGKRYAGSDCIVRAVALEKKLPDYATAEKLARKAGWRATGQYINPRTGKRYKSSRENLKRFYALMERLGYKKVCPKEWKRDNKTGTIDDVPNGAIAVLQGHVVFKDNNFIYDTFDSRVKTIHSENEADESITVVIRKVSNKDPDQIGTIIGDKNQIVHLEPARVYEWLVAVNDR